MTLTRTGEAELLHWGMLSKHRNAILIVKKYSIWFVFDLFMFQEVPIIYKENQPSIVDRNGALGPEAHGVVNILIKKLEERND